MGAGSGTPTARGHGGGSVAVDNSADPLWPAYQEYLKTQRGGKRTFEEFKATQPQAATTIGATAPSFPSLDSLNANALAKQAAERMRKRAAAGASAYTLPAGATNAQGSAPVRTLVGG